MQCMPCTGVAAGADALGPLPFLGFVIPGCSTGELRGIYRLLISSIFLLPVLPPL